MLIIFGPLIGMEDRRLNDYNGLEASANPFECPLSCFRSCEAACQEGPTPRTIVDQPRLAFPKGGRKPRGFETCHSETAT